MRKFVSIFLEELKQQGTPERAIWDRAYHKSKREHWGVPVPVSGQLAKRFSKELSEVELLEMAKALWNTDFFDPMLFATKILSLPKIKPTRVLWETVIEFLREVDGWALEDGLAHVAWKCILADESLLNEVEAWTKHSNFWMRRAALVYTLPFAKQEKNPERMLGWASTYVSDPEWFIQKAIGWWLRVLGEHNPDRVCTFLKTHWHELRSVAKKEATRKLGVSWNQILLESVHKLR